MRLRLRKLSSLATALAFLLATAIPAFAASDLNGYWAQAEIESLQASGIVRGYPDGTFSRRTQSAALSSLRFSIERLKLMLFHLRAGLPT